jgi:DNA modification methylase
MTVDQTRTLNAAVAREDKDERHLCPLQLDVIERAVRLWSNPGDTVASPFMGIGSEGVTALRLDRRFVGAELKPAYFQQAVGYLEAADAQLSLFTEA